MLYRDKMHDENDLRLQRRQLFCTQKTSALLTAESNAFNLNTKKKD